ncbi:MAG: hypothetical protein ACOCZG_01635 [Halothece sp.]
MKLLNRLSRLTAFGTGLCLMLAPSFSAQASVGDEFRVCAEELQEAGLSPDEASAACADAIRPKDLSLCVLSMNQEVGIDANEALSNCFRNRRPVELATCVIEINDFLDSDNLTPIVENCRRSVLPLRYSDCVVGLTETAEEEIAPQKAVEDCITAEDFPRALRPIQR